MIEASGRILRSDDVELDGQYHLGLSPAEFEAPGSGHNKSIMAAAQARIVENDPKYAVIEVTCSCGARVCLKCEYSEPGVSENS